MLKQVKDYLHMDMKPKDYFNIPNILCYIRILLIPTFVVLYLYADNKAEYMLSAGILFLSGLTDMFDGLIARKFNMITEWGKLIDPIADKLTQAAVAVCLSLKIDNMIYMLVIFVVKEITMWAFSMLLLSQNKKLNGALWYGKVSTVIFYIACYILTAWPTIPNMGRNILIIVVSAALLFAFIMYMTVFMRMKNEKKD